MSTSPTHLLASLRWPAALAACAALGLACAPAPVQVLVMPGDAASAEPDAGHGPLIYPDAAADLDATSVPPDASAPPADASAPDAGTPDSGTILCLQPNTSFDVPVRARAAGASRVGIPARVLGHEGAIHVAGVGPQGPFGWTIDSDATLPDPPRALGITAPMSAVDSLIPNPIDGSAFATFRDTHATALWDRGVGRAATSSIPVVSYVATAESTVLTVREEGEPLYTIVSSRRGFLPPLEYHADIGPLSDVRVLAVAGGHWITSTQDWDFPRTVFAEGVDTGTTLWGPRGDAYDAVAVDRDGTAVFTIVADRPEGIGLTIVEPTSRGPIHVQLATSAPRLASRVAWSSTRETILVATSTRAEEIDLQRRDPSGDPIGVPHLLRNPSIVEGAQLRWMAISPLDERWVVLTGVDEGVNGYLTLYVSEVSFCP